jgi:hypothetical protein
MVIWDPWDMVMWRMWMCDMVIWDPWDMVM